MEDEFKDTKCQRCGSNKRPLFMIQPALFTEDIACETCKTDIMKERAVRK